MKFDFSVSARKWWLGATKNTEESDIKWLETHRKLHPVHIYLDHVSYKIDTTTGHSKKQIGEQQAYKMNS